MDAASALPGRGILITGRDGRRRRGRAVRLTRRLLRSPSAVSAGRSSSPTACEYRSWSRNRRAVQSHRSPNRKRTQPRTNRRRGRGCAGARPSAGRRPRPRPLAVPEGTMVGIETIPYRSAVRAPWSMFTFTSHCPRAPRRSCRAPARRHDTAHHSAQKSTITGVSLSTSERTCLP
jgi:hypothetical protein